MFRKSTIAIALALLATGCLSAVERGRRAGLAAAAHETERKTAPVDAATMEKRTRECTQTLDATEKLTDPDAFYSFTRTASCTPFLSYTPANFASLPAEVTHNAIATALRACRFAASRDPIPGAPLYGLGANACRRVEDWTRADPSLSAPLAEAKRIDCEHFGGAGDCSPQPRLSNASGLLILGGAK